MSNNVSDTCLENLLGENGIGSTTFLENIMGITDAEILKFENFIQNSRRIDSLLNYYSEIRKDVFSHMDLELLEDGHFPGLLKSAYKKIIDLSFGFALGIVYFIIQPYVRKKIQDDSRGNFLHHRSCIGYEGREIKLLKFRSMIENTPDNINEERDGLGFPPGVNHQYITSFGSKLRVTKIDEIPQFNNLLNGTMSLVGSRPPGLAQYSKGLKYDAFTYYLRTNPGLIGLPQSLNIFFDPVSIKDYDIKYLILGDIYSFCYHNLSFAHVIKMDTKIIWNTAKSVIPEILNYCIQLKKTN